MRHPRSAQDLGVNDAATTVQGELVHRPGSSGRVVPEDASLQGQMITGQRCRVAVPCGDRRWKFPG